VLKVDDLQIHLERRFGSFFSSVYLPTMMLVLISFIGFFIPVQMVPGRMALLVTIFLMLVNISNSLKARGPNVGLNIWCFLHKYYSAACYRPRQ
jgi:hypothetical protein